MARAREQEEGRAITEEEAIQEVDATNIVTTQFLSPWPLVCTRNRERKAPSHAILTTTLLMQFSATN
jgi:hypothetical protein